MAETRFEATLREKLEQQRGVYFPVKASLAERLLKTQASPEILLPNAEDEFCMSGIGPNYGIISGYEDKIRDAQRKDQPVLDEPLIVEKMRPKGYLLINGHHRWAAALRMGIKKIPIKIVNLAQGMDIRKIINESDHDKRAVFDLDEVLLRSPDDPFLEKPLRFPYNLRFHKRIRLGVPALFYFLKQEGYDIWVYSANYYSYDDVKLLFRHYSAVIDGAITGMRKRSQMQKKFGSILSGKYKTTLHIDNDSVLLAQNNPEYYALNGNARDWSSEIMDVVKGFHAGDEKK
ncbi:MAG: ParB N-terminal domain-containing protein [Lachnospiraceae bacterium]|nr:ParB N-terminal domain-containing protein [Lachnospiraceae bacterium]